MCFEKSCNNRMHRPTVSAAGHRPSSSSSSSSSPAMAWSGEAAGVGATRRSTREARRVALATANARLSQAVHHTPAATGSIGAAQGHSLLPEDGLRRLSGGDVAASEGEGDDPRCVELVRRCRRRRMAYALDAWTVTLACSWGLDIPRVLEPHWAGTGAHNLAVSPEPPSPPHSALSGCSLGHTPVHVHSGIHEDDDEGEEEDYNDEEGSSEVVDFEEGAYNYSDSDEWGGGGNGRLIAWVDNALHARRAMRCLSRWRRFVKQRNELFRGSWYFERKAKLLALDRLLSRSVLRFNASAAWHFAQDAHARRLWWSALRRWRLRAQSCRRERESLLGTSSATAWARKKKCIYQWKRFTSKKAFCSISFNSSSGPSWATHAVSARRSMRQQHHGVVAVVRRRSLLALLDERTDSTLLRNSLAQWREYTLRRSRGYQSELRSFACYALTNVLRAFRSLGARAALRSRRRESSSVGASSMVDSRRLRKAFDRLRTYTANAMILLKSKFLCQDHHRRRQVHLCFAAWRRAMEGSQQRSQVTSLPEQETLGPPICQEDSPVSVDIDSGDREPASAGDSDHIIVNDKIECDEIVTDESSEDSSAEEGESARHQVLRRSFRCWDFTCHGKLIHRRVMAIAAAQHTDAVRRRALGRFVDVWIDALKRRCEEGAMALESSEPHSEHISPDSSGDQLEISSSGTDESKEMTEPMTDEATHDLENSVNEESNFNHNKVPRIIEATNSSVGIESHSGTTDLDSDFSLAQRVAEPAPSHPDENAFQEGVPPDMPRPLVQEDESTRVGHAAGSMASTVDASSGLRRAPPPLLSSFTPLASAPTEAASASPDAGLAQVPLDVDTQAFITAVRKKVAYI